MTLQTSDLADFGWNHFFGSQIEPDDLACSFPVRVLAVHRGGLSVAGPAIDVDIHRVAPPREDAHLHYDVRFLVVAPPGAELAINHESIEGRWVGWDETDVVPIDSGTRRLVAAGRRAVRELYETEDGKGAP